MSAEVLGQIEQAETYKQEGNTHFKEGNYKRALGNYHKVFCYVNGLSMPGEKNEAQGYADMMGKSNSSQVPADRVEDMKKLKQSTHLNMAACYLKVGDHQKCVSSCTKALAEGDQSKAFFRRGQAHLELRNLDEAKADFERAKALEPQDAAVDQQLKRLKLAFKQHEQKEKDKFKNMFSKLSKEDDSANVSTTEAAAETTTEPAAEAATAAA